MDYWEIIEEKLTTEIAEILGNYTIRTATGTVEKPAIWVFPPQPDTDRVVSGLEVIIQKTPASLRKRLSGEVKREKTVTLRLIHHDLAGNLEEAIDWVSEVLNGLPGAIRVSSRIFPQLDAADEQAVLEVTFLERVNA